MPEQTSALPHGVSKAVTTNDLVRWFKDPAGELTAALKIAGFTELPESLWLWSPSAEPASNHLNRFDLALDGAEEVTSEPEVEVLDPEQPVGFYKGRWKPLAKKHSGRYVARRPRRYGADAWAYVAVEDGEVVRLVDLPLFTKETSADARPVLPCVRSGVATPGGH